ncbi:winged helix-turn-helix domain-containing protein [Methanolobus sp. ZRKC5]|uniref:helix-turn-helix transcriptional regulator n=1 Tax=unclassified Methanolobus TaxID=2629569 RepID=UPI00313B7C0C
MLLLLNEGEKDIDEIKRVMAVTSTSILPQIKIMKKAGLIDQQADKHYVLSKIGTLVVAKLKYLCDICSLFDTDTQYWMKHDLSLIPEELLYNIGEICECSILQSNPISPFEPCEECIDCLNKSKVINSVLMFVHPTYPSIFAKHAQNGREITLIVGEQVFDFYKKNYKEEFDALIDGKNSRLFLVKENSKPFLFINTDAFMSLSLPDEGGVYDLKPICSYSPRSLKWGEDLFNHYLQIYDLESILTL